ncbi:MAG: hypothetical protein ACNI27_09095 [Desulfovibrio sp.]
MDEQREYSRVEARLKGFARKLTEGDGHLFHSVIPYTSSDRAQELSKAGFSDEVVDFFVNMDDKLNLILGMNKLDYLRQDFPEDINIYDISGAGVRMRHSSDLPIGAEMELVVMLSHLPFTAVSAIGSVQEKLQDGSMRFMFTAMREVDREAVVRFVFQQQREELRNRRNNS